MKNFTSILQTKYAHYHDARYKKSIIFIYRFKRIKIRTNLSVVYARDYFNK